MINKFAGTCYRCGGKVFAGTGYAEPATYEMQEAWKEHGFRRGWPRQQWMIEHHECRRLFHGTFVHHRFQPALNAKP